MIGRTLSHYEIVGEVSRGGMGVIYRAVDVNLGREVAIKVLPDELTHDPGRRERLLQEARAASSLEHPHIAVIHEVGESGGVTFIVMELIRGERLSDLLGRGPLSQARALALATEVAEALTRAHEKGIVHRDLKPSNVMITEDGHAKVIDFGLAKVFESAGADAATASVRTPRTDAGLVLGTAAYMSPEQARGQRVDHRSDIFALGVTLYEMVTGRPAFAGQSSLDTMHAILTQPVPALPALAGTPAEATAELQRIIGKATAKDPDDRFQGMKDLVVDLRAARRRLESAPVPPALTPAAGSRAASVETGFRQPFLLAAAVVALLLAGGGLLWWVNHEGAPPDSGRPALAVLYFENNTGDPSLDWMRTGLTDMLVTDLSQSPEFEVIGTDRLVQILQDLRRSDDRVLSAEVIQEIANRAGVDNVLVGSYVRAGGAIRISARLQEAMTGRIVSAERVEGPGVDSLFGLVDELTRRIKANIAAGPPTAGGTLVNRPGGEASETDLDRDLRDVTTSSIEAYRFYAEAMSFHDRGLSEQAAPLLERAVEIDPDFAMAHAKLAVVHNNMFSYARRDEHARRALDLVDRLTTRERYYIEGFYYGTQPGMDARSIEAYEQALRLHPEHQASRHNLGLAFMFLERYEEGIAQYEELTRRGTNTATSYENLTSMLIQTGNVRRARELADDFVRRYPENATGLRAQGAALIAEGRLDEARAAFERSEILEPLDPAASLGRRVVAMLQERWDEVESIDQRLGRSQSVFQRFLSHVSTGFGAVARGRGRDALLAWERGATLAELPRQFREYARNRATLTLLRQGRFEAALVHAAGGAVDAAESHPEAGALQLLATAQAAAGHTAESAKTLARLETQVKQLPGRAELRRVHWARGRIALYRGAGAAAVRELRTAVAMLPRHGPPAGPPSSHVDLWYDAAEALIEAGHDAEAGGLLERIQEGHERVFGPDAWARSFYRLGEIYERRGDAARAREQYTRFVELWGGGDLERGWVEDARKKLGR